MELPALYEILANLDFLVQGPNTRSLQDPRFDEYKNEILVKIARRLEDRLTIDEIEQQLLQAFQTREGHSKYNFDLLFRHGSSVLGLGKEIKMSVESHLCQIRLGDALEVTPRNKRLRSFVLISAEHRKRQAGTAYSKSFSSLNKFEREPKTHEQLSIPNSKIPSKRNHRHPKYGTTQSSYPVSRIQVDETPYNSPYSKPSTIAFESPVSKSDERLAERRASLSEDAESISLDLDIDPPTILLTRTNYLTMASELIFYKERCKKAEHECRIAKNQRRQIKSLCGIPEDVKKALSENTRTISDLKRKLDDRTKLERYLCFSNAQSAAPNSPSFITQFHILKDQITAVLVVNGLHEPPIRDLKGSSADLDCLLLSVFGEEISCHPTTIPDIFPALTSYELAQALAGASICSWIFGSDYQTHVMGVTPLLEEYRNLISTWYGHETLCDLDLAVHQSIIESESFKEVTIPRMGKILADRLTNAFQPLSGEKENLEAIEKLRPSLYAILCLAIQIRAESLISGKHFELIWPSVGSLFDEMEMEAKHSGPMAVANVVRLPLCPGIRVCAKGKAMVDYSGFVMSGASRSSAEYVIKALVLC